jgi:hypothetical protein
MNLNDLFTEEKVRLDPACWHNKKIGKPKTKVKGGVRVNNCVPKESVEEGLGDQGNFAGDTPVNIGGNTVKRLVVGDIVSYLGQKSKILAQSKDRKYSRITIASDFGGTTKDVLTSDLKRLGQTMAEDNLNELDMFAPVTTYVRLANGTYVAANWRRNQNLSTASNSASFIDIKPLAPNVAKQLGLDQRLNDPEKKYTGATTIASGGPIQASGPFSDKTINVVDIRDPKAAKDSGVPDTLFGKIAQWAQQQGQKQPGVTEGVMYGAENLHVGDDVIISGDVELNGATGVIDSFGQDKRFVVVNLFNHGPHSFHSSDVSANDYDNDEHDDLDETRRGQIPMTLNPGETDNLEPENLAGFRALPAYKQGQAAQQKAGKQLIQKSPYTFQSDQDWAYRQGAFDTQQAAMFANFGKSKPLTTAEGEQKPGADYRDPPEDKDPDQYGDDYQAMVARVKKLAGLGPMKTVYDPAKRQYRNMPTAVQPKK